MVDEEADAVVKAVEEIATKYIDMELTPAVRDQILGHIDAHEAILRAMFENRMTVGPKLGVAENEGYFSGKVVGLTGFAKMAVDPTTRESYGTTQILENVRHFAYSVRGLLPAHDEQGE
ncbi:hypothetical protein [Litoreibacter janthinus]|uniref:Uncharacterized protein n=1 Tax=Litoreibacter janthinus TaxID=670154 RepID=A0A1I6GAB4_9RHOB|nr:hypothetical protein [Litoreibacter janthinus]SFR39156.1 hypothetical protein SAMN04488002_1145 [Litoreibacter janthinus]